MFVSLVFFVFSSFFLSYFLSRDFTFISLIFFMQKKKGEGTHVSTLSTCQPRVCVLRRIKRVYDNRERERERHGVLREI